MGKLFFKSFAFMCWQKLSRATWSHQHVQGPTAPESITTSRWDEEAVPVQDEVQQDTDLLSLAIAGKTACSRSSYSIYGGK